MAYTITISNDIAITPNTSLDNALRTWTSSWTKTTSTGGGSALLEARAILKYQVTLSGGVNVTNCRVEFRKSSSAASQATMVRNTSASNPTVSQTGNASNFSLKTVGKSHDSTGTSIYLSDDLWANGFLVSTDSFLSSLNYSGFIFKNTGNYMQYSDGGAGWFFNYNITIRFVNYICTINYMNGDTRLSTRKYTYNTTYIISYTYPGSYPEYLDPDVYNLTYNLDGGGGAETSQRYERSKYKTYTCNSWNLGKNGDKITITSKTVNLKAVFTPGSINYGPYPSLRNPGTPKKEGHSFQGWSPSLPSTVQSSGTYTARWLKNQYTVKFIKNDGSGITQEIHPYYEDAVSAPSWTSNPGTTNAYTVNVLNWKPSIVSPCKANATYTAQWKYKWYLNINLNWNSSFKESMPSITAKIDREQGDSGKKLPTIGFNPTISIPTPNAVTYKNVRQTDFMTPLSDDNRGSSTGTEVYTLKWEDTTDNNTTYDPGYNWKFDRGANLRGKWNLKSTTYVLKFKVPDVKDKTGYKFLGWSTNEKAKTAEYIPSNDWKTANTKTLTLYPVYEPIKRTVIRRYYTSDRDTTYTEDKPYEYTIETPQFSLYGPKNSSGQNIIYNNENIYAFLGWSMDKSLKIPNYVAEQASQSWESTHGVYQLLSEDEYKKISLPLTFNPAELKSDSDWGTYENGKYKATGIKHYAYGIWTFSGKYIKIKEIINGIETSTWKKIVDAKVKIGGKWKRILDMQFKKQIGTTSNGNWKKEAGRRT